MTFEMMRSTAWPGCCSRSHSVPILLPIRVVAWPKVMGICVKSASIWSLMLMIASAIFAAVSSPSAPSAFNSPWDTPKPSARYFMSIGAFSRSERSSSPCNTPDASACDNCMMALCCSDAVAPEMTIVLFSSSANLIAPSLVANSSACDTLDTRDAVALYSPRLALAAWRTASCSSLCVRSPSLIKPKRAFTLIIASDVSILLVSPLQSRCASCKP